MTLNLAIVPNETLPERVLTSLMQKASEQGLTPEAYVTQLLTNAAAETHPDPCGSCCCSPATATQERGAE